MPKTPRIKTPEGIKKYLRKDSDDYVWWHGRRMSTNVEDKRDFGHGKDPMLANNEVLTGSTRTKKFPDRVKVPPNRPLNIKKSQVTPGKWTTK